MSAEAWVPRQDRGELLHLTDGPAGSILCEGVVAKAGILVYTNADGSQRRELVTEAVLAESAGGLGRAPVTLTHPSSSVTPETVQRDGIGDADGEVTVERGGFVKVRLCIRRADGVKALRSGVRELSPGYDVLLGPGGHHPTFGAFDAEQLRRRYNHISLVPEGRGGPSVGVRTDAVESVPRPRSRGCGAIAREQADRAFIGHQSQARGDGAFVPGLPKGASGGSALTFSYTHLAYPKGETCAKCGAKATYGLQPYPATPQHATEAPPVPATVYACEEHAQEAIAKGRCDGLHRPQGAGAISRARADAAFREAQGLDAPASGRDSSGRPLGPGALSRQHRDSAFEETQRRGAGAASRNRYADDFDAAHGNKGRGK